MSMFNPLSVSSKFAICGLPLRLDSYSLCSYGCTYCFANNRRIGRKPDKEANTEWLRRKFHKVYDEGETREGNFIDALLRERITLHGGTMSDCFQPCERTLKQTQKIVEICNDYDQHILFSTKSNCIYSVGVQPELHSFQLSVTNTDGLFEPGVPPVEERKIFFDELKDKGFKVGIRLQPFIPGITDYERIVDLFSDADHYTVECLKFVPHNKEYNEKTIRELGFSRGDWKQKGLLHLDPEKRLRLYEPVIGLLEDKGYSWSVADNDLHWLGNNKCCCGDRLVHKQTLFHNTRLIKEYGKDYKKDDLLENLKGFEDCKCSSLFTSDRREGCKTVKEFCMKRFGRGSSPFSPKFQYYD